MTAVSQPEPGAGPAAGPAAGAPDAGEAAAVTPGWRLALREFAANRAAVSGVAVLLFFILFCFLGPLLHPTDQVDTALLATNQPPGAVHPLGTDAYGFDVLGRIMLGGRTSLEIGLLAAVLATVIGTLWGAVAGLLGGLADAAMMRVVDILLALPFLLIVLIIAHRYGSNVWNLALILGVFSWLVPARLVRGEVLTLRVRDFVSAARVMGAGRAYLITRHLIPNALGVVLVNVTFQIADAILALAALGFLGFGVHYPRTDWGSQISDAAENLSNGYWWLVFPVGTALVLVVMAFNLIGDGLRDAVDVRLRRR
ncbi:ABC transporter permease [Phaeacidiphilus oryzae]|uniref:ABC transporter permease n=1 Tax=Phaeacidiphilus oryzae TaxID=348818 RepID=UPI000A062891|nr:ABC transporter permease [Phaeacidiphilus oryzae]